LFDHTAKRRLGRCPLGVEEEDLLLIIKEEKVCSFLLLDCSHHMMKKPVPKKAILNLYLKTNPKPRII